MSFAAENLAIVAHARNCSLLHYETVDAAQDLCDSTYFQDAAGVLRRGDLIFSTCVRPDSRKTNLLLVSEVADGKVYVTPLENGSLEKLEEVANVIIDTARDGQVLSFKNGVWVNQDAIDPSGMTASDIGAIDVSEKGQPTGVATLDAEGYVQSSQVRASALASLRDVLIADPVAHQVLKFDGAVWTSQPELGAAGDAFAATHGGSRGAAHMTATLVEAGFMSSADKGKLDGIETSATADMTGAAIKAAYEGEANTNAFTDAEKLKLAEISVEAGRNVNADWDASGTAAEIFNKPSIPTNSDDIANVSTVPGATVSDALESAVAHANSSIYNEPYGSSWSTDAVNGASRASIHQKIGTIDTELASLYSTVQRMIPARVPVAFKVADVDNGFVDYGVGSALDGSGSPIVIDLTVAYDEMILVGMTDNDGGTGGAFALFIVGTNEKISADIPFDEAPFRVRCTEWANLSPTAKAMNDAVIEPRITIAASTGTSTPDLRNTYLHVYYGGMTTPDFGTTSGTFCEGDDDRIPDAEEEAFLAMVSQSGDDFTITPPNNGGFVVNVTPSSHGVGFLVYSGSTPPTTPTPSVATFVGDVVIKGNIIIMDDAGRKVTITPATEI
jgi:hypothetical protein